MTCCAFSALRGSVCWNSACALTRLKTEKAIPLITNAPADSPKVSARVATARGTSRKKAAVLKTRGRPEGCRAEDHSEQGACISGVASCQADAQDVLRRVPPLEKRQLLC